MTLEVSDEGVILSRFTKENIQEIIAGILASGSEELKKFLYKEVREALKTVPSADFSQLSLREHTIVADAIDICTKVLNGILATAKHEPEIE